MATNSVSLMSVAIVQRSFRLDCWSDGVFPSSEEGGSPVGDRLITLWLSVGAKAGDDAAMLAACVQNISRKFWLIRPLMSRGEQDLVPIFSGCSVAVFPSKAECWLLSDGALGLSSHLPQRQTMPPIPPMVHLLTVTLKP